MNKRRDEHWFRNSERETQKREETEHFYGAGFVTHGLREHINAQPRRYDQRQYPRHCDPGHRRR